MHILCVSESTTKKFCASVAEYGAFGNSLDQIYSSASLRILVPVTFAGNSGFIQEFKNFYYCHHHSVYIKENLGFHST